jgi:hypothetical protein
MSFSPRRWITTLVSESEAEKGGQHLERARCAPWKAGMKWTRACPALADRVVTMTHLRCKQR